jgi:hypothetical protein
MNRNVLSFLLAILPLALFGASGTAIPGGNQAASYIINKPGAYYLAASRVMTDTAQPAIQITASDVTLDLNGFTLAYADVAGTGDAILAKGSNIEIRNGSISTVPGHAINSPDEPKTIGMRVIDVRVDDTKGLYLGSEGAWVERCQIFASRGYALVVEGWGGTVKDCVVKKVIKADALGSGISVGNFGTIVGCNVAETAYSGIIVGLNGNIRNNRVDQANMSLHPAGAGIHLSWAQRSRVSDNFVNLSSAAGIRLMNASAGCFLERNVVTGTYPGGTQTGYGIVIDLSPTTILRGNLGSANGGGFISGTHINGGDNLSN